MSIETLAPPLVRLHGAKRIESGLEVWKRNHLDELRALAGVLPSHPNVVLGHGRIEPAEVLCVFLFLPSKVHASWNDRRTRVSISFVRVV